MFWKGHYSFLSDVKRIKTEIPDYCPNQSVKSSNLQVYPIILKGMPINRSDTATRDQHLLDEIAAGDSGAFEQLMRCYVQSIHGLILPIVRINADAELLTQETFTKVFVNIAQYNPKYSFSSWLYRIAHNHAIDYLRRKKFTDQLFVSVESATQLADLGAQSDSANPEEVYIKQEKAFILRKLIAGLHAKYRIPLEMRYFKEYTYPEMANELHLPIGTIKVRLCRSRKLLHEKLVKNHITCY